MTKDDIACFLICLVTTAIAPPFGVIVFLIFGAYKLVTFIGSRPRQPPLRSDNLKLARKRLDEELQFAQSLKNPDERKSYEAGAHNRFRKTLVQLSEQD